METEAIRVLDDVAKAQSILYMQQGSFATAIRRLNIDGDISVHDAGDAWDAMDFTRINDEEHGHGEGMQMQVQRSGGMFQDGILQVAVFADGTIARRCSEMFLEPNSGFCTMAQNAGYAVATEEETIEL